MKLADFLTGDEVMKTFNIDMSMLRRWHHRGLPVIRVGKGRWLVHELSLCAWLKGRESSQPVEGGVRRGSNSPEHVSDHALWNT